jgi:regulator of sirC expression with transglutaminase-like and TPR domain
MMKRSFPTQFIDGLARLTPVLGVVMLALATKPVTAQDSTEPLPTSQLASQLQPSLVTIRQIDRRGEEGGIGSGFFIEHNDRTYIATNLHVIGEGRAVRITDSQGRQYTISGIRAWSRAHDLAVLEVELHDDSIRPAPMADADSTLEKGHPIIALGNPQGFEYSVVEGIISGVRSFDSTEMYQLAIPIEPGNSGGPLIDRFGNVHGILTLKSLVTENLGFAVRISHLHQLLENPNPIAMKNWIRLGELNPRIWTNVFGATWKRRQGSIYVSGPGNSFGGRSLALRNRPVSELPYEISVRVKLDDEAGAAGIAFAADGSDRHWGFYPSAGNIRLTHFKGPDVYSWEIVGEVTPPGYKLNDWNELRVLLTKGRIEGFLNGVPVLSASTDSPLTGLAGLAKFRDTGASFANFRILRADGFPSDELRDFISGAVDRSLDGFPETGLDSPLVAANPEAAASLLHNEAMLLRQKAAVIEKAARRLHENTVTTTIMSRSWENGEPDIIEAALLLGTYDNPELDIDSYRQQINAMAEEILISLPDFATQQQRVEALIDHLFVKNGFRGSRSDYENKANSFLSQVIDDREGLPITLSILTMELGRKIFIDGLSGAAFPGHFMVCWEREDGSLRWIDAYDGGRIHDAATVSARIFGEVLPEDQLRIWNNTRPYEVLVRMTRNLANFSTSPENRKYLDLLVQLVPEDAGARFQRAFEYIQAREPESARTDLEYLLETRPEGINLRRLQAYYDSLFR